MTTVNRNADAAASRGLLATARHISMLIAARFSPAQITSPRPKAGGATNITALQVERERLIADLKNE